MKLAAAQRICPDFAAIYVVLLAQSAGQDQRVALGALKKSNEELVGGRKYDTWIEMADKFELIDGVLFRRVYDAIEGEVQL